MVNFDKYTNDTQAYINGRMDDQTKAKFEALLTTDPALRRSVEDFMRLKSGLNLYDLANEGHIASEQLAWYTTDPDQLTAEKISEIETHLESCQACTEEFKLCGSKPTPAIETESTNMFSSIISWFLNPASVLKPVVALGLVLICLLPAMLLYTIESESLSAISYHNLTPSGQRSVGSVNEIAISRDQQLIDLSFTLPVSTADVSYVAELVDNKSRLILRVNQEPTENSFALQLPVSYLDEGRYTLTIKEISNDLVESDLGSFVLNISFSD